MMPHLFIFLKKKNILHIHLNPSQNISSFDLFCKYLPTFLSLSHSLSVSEGVTAQNTRPGCLSVSSGMKCPKMQQRWQRESCNEAHLMKAFVESTAVFFFPSVLLWVRPDDRYEIKIEGREEGIRGWKRNRGINVNLHCLPIYSDVMAHNVNY